MTNREYLKSRGVIPPAIIALLQPLFDFDLRLAKIVVPKRWKYDGATYMVASGRTIYISDDYRMRAHELPFLQRLAHELWHVREYVRLGWSKHNLLKVRDWLLSLRQQNYWEYECPEEKAAYAKEHEVYLWLATRPDKWRGLLERECE